MPPVPTHLPTALARLSDNLFLWSPPLCDTWGLANCLLISGPSAILVDTPYDRPMSRALRAAAEQVLPHGSRIDTVVNTHTNGDHSYGNAFFQGSEIISTHASLEHLCAEPTPQQMHHLSQNLPADDPLGWYMALHFSRFQYADTETTPPTKTFTGTLQLEAGDTKVELIEVGPAHTAGDLIVHLPEDGVVCAGDIVFSEDHPVHWNGPLDHVAKACEKILSLDCPTIVPGHGPVMDRTGLRTHLDYLRELEGLIHERHARGLTAPEAAADILDSGFHTHLGLSERIVILAAVEYRHLSGDTSSPDLVRLARGAAEWAFTRRDTVSLPRPRGAQLHTQAE